MDEEIVDRPPQIPLDMMDDTISSLFTRRPTIQGEPTQSSDAPLAQQSGFGYGSPLAGLVSGVARQYRGPTAYDNAQRMADTVQLSPMATPEERMQTENDIMMAARDNFINDMGSSVHTKIGRGNSFMQDRLTQEALMINRIPFATYGYSPQATVVDARRDTVPGVAGFFQPQTDTTYAANYPQTLTHESIHRGLDKLLKDPEGSAIISEMLHRSPNSGWYNLDEDIVRYTQRQHDPEYRKDQPEFHERSSRRFKDETMVEMLRQLEAVAQKRIAQRNPRGPR